MIFFILGGALVLGVCIFIHELGHYVFGYLVGVRAEIFSIGYGKGIWKKKIGVTTWQITAIPLGGYVKFYGEENSKKKVPGGFYSAPPLRRIIPVLGGPFFNLLLGFLILLLLHSLSGPLSPRAVLSEESSSAAVARQAGIQNGDLIRKVNGQPMHSFMELVQFIALSEGKTLEIELERDGKLLKKEVRPDVLPSGINSIGLRMPGERYIQVNYRTLSVWHYRLKTWLGAETLPRNMRALPYLKDGDVLLSVEGERPRSVKHLQGILGRHHGKTVSVRVRRERYPWLTSWLSYEKTIEVPVYPEYVVNVLDLVDKKYGQRLPDQQLHSAAAEHQYGLNFISINGRSAGSFQRLAQNYKQNETVRIRMGARSFSARLKSQRIGLMGFSPATLIHGDYLDYHPSFFAGLREAARDLINNIMIYPAFFKGLFSGRLSFFDNAAGPLRIFGAAGIVLESGFQNYLHLFAAISIALFIMNLLPFPVVDGGHIALFLYEAAAGKPLSARIRETLHKLGFGALLFVGIWIMYRDVLWFLGL